MKPTSRRIIYFGFPSIKPVPTFRRKLRFLGRKAFVRKRKNAVCCFIDREMSPFSDQFVVMVFVFTTKMVWFVYFLSRKRSKGREM